MLIPPSLIKHCGSNHCQTLHLTAEVLPKTTLFIFTVGFITLQPKRHLPLSSKFFFFFSLEKSPFHFIWFSSNGGIHLLAARTPCVGPLKHKLRANTDFTNLLTASFRYKYIMEERETDSLNGLGWKGS